MIDIKSNSSKLFPTVRTCTRGGVALFALSDIALALNIQMDGLYFPVIDIVDVCDLVSVQIDGSYSMQFLTWHGLETLAHYLRPHDLYVNDFLGWLKELC